MGFKKEPNNVNNIVELEFTGERIVPGKPPYIIYQEHINRYIFASRFVKNKIVLDVASGTGYGSNYLIENGAKKVIGLDISNDAITFSRKTYKKDHLNFIQGDATNLLFGDKSFNVIVSFETIEHLKDYRKFLIECKRVLKNDGVFICSTPNKKVSSAHTEKPFNPFHVKEFYPDEFYNLLNEYFTNIDLYGQCNINLFKRRIIELGGKILSIVFNGDAIKDVINKFIQNFNSNREVELNNAKLEESKDEDYKVSKFKNNQITTPSYLIAVAGKSERLK
jgi:ubiquinone/menaquinone biosynthesis C-methylase UbiE